MPLSDKPLYLELTKHTLLVTRASGTSIEIFRECALDNKPGVEEILSSLDPDWKANGLPAVAALAPLPVWWHLSSTEEAARYRTETKLREFGATLPHALTGNLELTCCHAADGTLISSQGSAPWLLGLSTAEGLASTGATATNWRIAPARSESSTLSHVGGIVTALRHAGRGAVVLWDLALDRSQLFLLTPRGVEALVPCGAGLDTIFGAVQTAIGLKFRAAAARLFFNETYDFSEIGAQVAAPIAAALQAARAQLPAAAQTAGLACTNLTGKQAWFVREAATAAGLQPWTPDLRLLAAQLKLQFSDNAIEPTLTPAALGLLHLVSSQANRTTAWHPVWTQIGTVPLPSSTPLPFVAPPAPAAPPPPAPVPVVVPVAPTPAAVVVPPVAAVIPAAVPAPVVSPKPAPVPPAPAVAKAVAPAAKPAAAVNPPAPSPAPAPAPVSAVAPVPVQAPKSQPAPKTAPAPVAAKTTPAASGKAQNSQKSGKGNQAAAKNTANAKTAAAAAAAPAVATKPAPATPAPAPAKPAAPTASSALVYPGLAATTSSSSKGKKSSLGLYLGIAAAVIVAIAGFMWKSAEDAKTAKLVAEKAAAAEKLRNDEIRAKAEAEAKAKAEAARLQRETEAKATQAREEAARQQQAQQQEAERIAKSPGTLVLTTAPSLASISVDGGPAQKSPLTLGDLAPGSHRVRVTMAGHDSVEQTFEIKGTQTTDLGVIQLQRAFGSIAIASQPAGVEFSARPALILFGASPRTGRTPATLDDVEPGDYVVTFSHAPWKDQTQTVTVAKRAEAKISAAFTDSVIRFTSTPDGATVKRNGTVLGTTPFTIQEPAQKTSYVFSLRDYEDLTVPGEALEGQILDLNGKLRRVDRIAQAGEVKQQPKALEQPGPQLSPAQRRTTADIVIAVTVGRDGKLRDLTVTKSTDKDIERVCVEALKKWKFEPALGNDNQPISVRLSIPFRIGAN